MKLKILVALTTMTALAACGGGSGGGTVSVVPPSALLEITPNNAMTVASVTYTAALDSGNLADLSGDAGLTANDPGRVSKTDAAFFAASKSSNTGSQVPIPPETTPCAVAGSTTLSGDIADPITPTLTAGDFFEIEFAMCDDGFGEVTDGSVRLDIVSFSGDLLSEVIQLTSTLTLGTFQVTTDTDVVTSDGDATVALDALQFPFVSTTVSGDSLRVSTNSSSESLTNYVSMSTVDGSLAPPPFTTSTRGTLDSSQLDGAVSYSTPVVFAGVGAEFPSSGEFLVEGANSSLRLIAESDVNVRIEIDSDGDGTVDETINTTWDELTG